MRQPLAYSCLIFCVLIVAVVIPLSAQPPRDARPGAIDAYNAQVVVSGENGVVAL
jgi:hypothetical protein